MSHSYVIELIVPQNSNFAKLFCVFFIIFSFFLSFSYKNCTFTRFSMHFSLLFLSYYNDFCVFFFVYNTQKSQSLFTEKTLGFHFYIKVIQFFKNVFFLQSGFCCFFFSLSKISNYLFLKQILSILFDHILIPIKTIFLISI